MKTNRSLGKFILFSFLTFGIYGVYQMATVGKDLNILRPQDRKTMNYWLIVLLFTALTCGIAPLVWTYRIAAKLGSALQERGIAYDFGTNTFWSWFILGSLIAVGPFVFLHKLFKAMNLAAADYNK